VRLLNTIVCLGLIVVSSPTNFVAARAPQSSDVVFLPDADRPAKLWADQNPASLAIAIRLGPETTVPTERIEEALRSDFAAHGLQRVRLFWERGSSGGSSVIYITRNHAWGPFGLAESRQQVGKAAEQLLFEVERGIH